KKEAERMGFHFLAANTTDNDIARLFYRAGFYAINEIKPEYQARFKAVKENDDGDLEVVFHNTVAFIHEADRQEMVQPEILALSVRERFARQAARFDVAEAAALDSAKDTGPGNLNAKGPTQAKLASVPAWAREWFDAHPDVRDFCLDKFPDESLQSIILQLQQTPERLSETPETEVVEGAIRQMLRNAATSLKTMQSLIEGENIVDQDPNTLFVQGNEENRPLAEQFLVEVKRVKTLIQIFEAQDSPFAARLDELLQLTARQREAMAIFGASQKAEAELTWEGIKSAAGKIEEDLFRYLDSIGWGRGGGLVGEKGEIDARIEALTKFFGVLAAEKERESPGMAVVTQKLSGLIDELHEILLELKELCAGRDDLVEALGEAERRVSGLVKSGVLTHETVRTVAKHLMEGVHALEKFDRDLAPLESQLPLFMAELAKAEALLADAPAPRPDESVPPLDDLLREKAKSDEPAPVQSAAPAFLPDVVPVWSRSTHDRPRFQLVHRVLTLTDRLHSRPVTLLMRVLAKYPQVELSVERPGQTPFRVLQNSIISVLMQQIKKGEATRWTAKGPGADEVMDAIELLNLRDWKTEPGNGAEAREPVALALGDGKKIGEEVLQAAAHFGTTSLSAVYHAPSDRFIIAPSDRGHLELAHETGLGDAYQEGDICRIHVEIQNGVPVFLFDNSDLQYDSLAGMMKVKKAIPAIKGEGV
ncbi:MAG: HPr family phosphocarrier protein, partial [Deltaproteobacteria bacterium]|nr:HPr family phosphocarrier protein [Deltaproteobacteria bacterium]